MLKIKDLTKHYGKFLALDSLNLDIEKESIYGFVGPNGAGKTTTMKIVSGILKPDSGQVYVDGINAIDSVKELKNKIGYMPDFFGVYDNLKTIEYMEFYASLYGIVGKESRKLCNDLLDLVDLQPQYNSYVDDLSRGMKQRLCLARSLVHNPQLLILDEPASGLDPRARIQMKEIVKELKNKGKTILISSHILPELASMCTHIGIIEKGIMAITGTVEEVLQTRGSARPIVIGLMEGQELAVEVLKKNPMVQNLIIHDNRITIMFKGNELEEAKLLSAIVSEGALVYSFKREESDLEALFMQLTKEDIKEV